MDAADPADPDRASKRRFAMAFALAALLGWVALGGAVYAVNPYAEYPTRLFRPLVVTETEQKLPIYQAAGRDYDTVLLGSSVALFLSPDRLREAGYGDSFNYAMFSLVPADMLALYSIMDANGRLPGHLILSLDYPMMVRPDIHHLLDVQRATRPAFPPSLQDAGDALLSALNLQLVLDAGRVLHYSLTGYPTAIYGFGADGRYLFHQHFDALLAQTPEQRQRVVEAQVEEGRDLFEGRALREDRIGPALELARRARADGLAVTILVPPLSPAFRDAFGATPPTVDATLRDLVAALRTLCGEGVGVHDLSDAAAQGWDDAGFLDLLHPTPQLADGIVARLGDGAGSACPAA